MAGIKTPTDQTQKTTRAEVNVNVDVDEDLGRLVGKS